MFSLNYNARIALLLVGTCLLPAGALGAKEDEAVDPQCNITNERSGTGEAFLIQEPRNEYQRDTNRLLRLEIENLKQAVGEIEVKRLQLVRIRKSDEGHQTIQLENSTGVYRNGLKSNYLSRIRFVFRADRLHCLLLESHTRPVYEPEKWTHKVIRLRFPGIESLELFSERRNMHLLQRMENVNPTHQLELLRKLTLNIKTALYSMDMEIAAYYENRNKKNRWQLDM